MQAYAKKGPNTSHDQEYILIDIASTWRYYRWTILESEGLAPEEDLKPPSQISVLAACIRHSIFIRKHLRVERLRLQVLTWLLVHGIVALDEWLGVRQLCLWSVSSAGININYKV